MLLLLVGMFLYRFYFFYTYSLPGRSFTGSTFLLGLRYDARVVAVIGLSMLLLCIVPFLNPFKNRAVVKFWVGLLSLVFLIFLLAYITDFYYYDYLQQRLNATIVNFLPDLSISFAMVRETYPVLPLTLMLVLVLAIYAWLQYKLLKKIIASPSPPAKRHRWYFVATGLVLAALIFGRLGQYPLRWSDAFSLGDDFKGHTALNPFQSFFSSLKFRSASYDLPAVKKYYPDMAAYLGVDKPDINNLNFERVFNYRNTGAAKPNIVVVICESFSSSKSSMYGNKLNSTPYFNQLCEAGVFFTRCFTPAFGTARGVWATLTGTPDVQNPTTASRNPLAVNQHSIMNDFKQHSKYYFLGGSTTWANIRGVLTNNIEGLKIFEEDSFDAGVNDVWGISDKDLFLAANEQLSKESKPFFAIIQTAGNHRPYTIPAEDMPEFELVNYPEDTLRKYGFISNDQLNAFRYSDFCFQKYFEAAAKEKYFDNTIFVFVGDHGIRGEAGDGFPQSYTRQGFTAQHVPLLFYAPALFPAKKIDDVCSQLDVLPSVAYLARQSHRNTTMGRNLFDSSRRQEPYAFIADPDTRFISLLSNEYYYGRQLDTRATDFVSIIDDKAVVATAATDSIKNTMAWFTEGWYETARYLLLNNKKK